MNKAIITAELNLGDKWEISGETSVTGSAFIDGNLVRGKEGAALFETLGTDEKVNALKKINGFFAVVQVTDTFLFAAVDRVKSIPVFYTLKGNLIYLSDDPYWIRQRINAEERDEQTSNELMLTRYVTGRDTLYSQIKQLQAGEYLFIDRTKDLDEQETAFRYYLFSHKDASFLSMDKALEKQEKEALLEQNAKILERAFGRFAEWAGGRPVIVPLSGGYDSRLVVLMLKRIRYDNIQTFSFGKKDNPEAVISRQVAKNLELPWHFVPYEPEMIYHMTNSAEWKQFNRMADGLYCTCFDRDWPAVGLLKRDGWIPENSIFVPGHSGDFISGGHIRDGFAEKRTVSENEFFDEIIKRHYTMWKWNGMKDTLQPKLYQRIKSCTGVSGDMERQTAVDAYERWVWQEFESKYLVNGIRVYEFWGYDWWLPLWDAEYMDFWSGVPLKWRLNKKLYNAFVFRLYSEMAGISYRKAQIRNDSLDGISLAYDVFLKYSKGLIRKTPLKPLAAAIRDKVSEWKPSLPKAETMELDWEQCQGRLNQTLYSKLVPYMTNRSSCVTLEKLGYLSFTDEDVLEETITLLKKMKGL